MRKWMHNIFVVVFLILPCLIVSGMLIYYGFKCDILMWKIGGFIIPIWYVVFAYTQCETWDLVHELERSERKDKRAIAKGLLNLVKKLGI